MASLAENKDALVDAGTNEATWLSPELVKDLIRLEKLDADLPENRQTTHARDRTDERMDAPGIDTGKGSWSRAKPVSGNAPLLDRLYTTLGDLDPKTLPQVASALAQAGHYGSLVRIIAITGGATTLLSLLPTKSRLTSHQIALLAYCCGGKAVLRRALDLTRCLADWNSSGESERATVACLALALTFGFRSVCVARYRPARAHCPLHGLVCDAVLDAFWTEIDYIEATHQQLEAQWRSLLLSNAEAQSLASGSTFPTGCPSPVLSTEDQSMTWSGEASSLNEEPRQVYGKMAIARETTCRLKNDSAEDHQERVHDIQIASPRLIRRKPNYVIVASRRKALDQLRAAVAYGAPVFLQGESGSGKRSILHYLAAETNRSVTTFYWDRLGFEEDAFLDAIAMIAPSGPGRFQWRLGPVGEALVQGHWLVMEGLGTSTHASRRFATSMVHQLASLRPGDVFELPGRGLALQLHMNFRLFATRSLSYAETVTTTRNALQDRSSWNGWMVVSLTPYPAVERRQVLVQRFPTSAAWIDRVLASVDICAASSQKSSGSSRSPGLTEAVRLVARLERIQQALQMPLTPETALLHAMDVLLQSEHNCRDVALRQLASLWSVSEHEATALALQASASPPMQVLLERMVLAPTQPTCMALRQLSVALEHEEPVLLIGEAGVGKTYLVQELARSLGRHLVVLNMSQQSDLAELLGGYQPVDAQRLLLDLARQLEIAFAATFSSRQNTALLHQLRQMARRRDVGRLVRLARGLLTRVGASARLNDTNVIHWEQVQRLVRQTEDAYGTEVVRRRPRRPAPKASAPEQDSERQGAAAAAAAAARPHKRAGSETQTQDAASNESIQTGSRHDENQTSDTDEAAFEYPSGPSLRFAFKEGMLAAAIRQGDLVLLDELNLAPPACLERLTGILDTLNEPPASAPAARLAAWQTNEMAHLAGSGMIRHPDFRLIACMNPETNIGRRALPQTLQRRFTTIMLSDDLVESDLHQIVEHMFTRRLYSDRHQVASGGPVLTERVVAFYREVRTLSRSQLATAGDETAPRFSLRALGRMLRLATHLTRKGLDARRALYEGACLGFASFLDDASRQRVLGLAHTLLGPELTENDLSQPVTKLLMPSSSFASRAVIDLGGQWLAVYPGHRATCPAGTPPCRAEALNDPQRLTPGHDLEHQPRTSTAFTFVCTPTMERALCDIARALVDGLSKTPVLIEGATAAGKTALVQYIAQCTGHELIRLNQHEHTEVSEYLGRYTIGPNSDLVFVEGPLVRAARNGHWVLLDELNLAPGDVLESINRLLDENRELIIPETGQVIQAHPHFALFATQNPSGGTGIGGAHARYAGRKSLSPAFRSRFMLIHLPEMKDKELVQILCVRYALPTSFATAMVNVLRDLQLRRSAERIFAGAEGLVTARDLFRWASRQPRDRRSLLFHGRCLLVERIRQAPERAAVWRILCRHVGVSAQGVTTTTTNATVHERSQIETLHTIDDDDDDDLKDAGTAWEQCSWALETLQHGDQECAASSRSVAEQVWRRVLHVAQECGLVLVPALRRLLRLALHCIIHCEPVLFIGETGIGKSTVCSVLATALGRELITMNGHRHTEAADLVGRYVPCSAPSVASKPSFVWQDGLLTMAMRRGAFLLLDEVNMVDDAVIERLNSVLEPSGQLVLSERGGDPLEVVQAAPSFRVFACMNPSGDFGKKELSTAIRNRFTEIWVPFEGSWNDLWPIASSLLAKEPPAIRRLWQEALAWLLEHQQRVPNMPAMSIRDLTGWIRVYRAACNRWRMAPGLALAQGIEAVWGHRHHHQHHHHQQQQQQQQQQQRHEEKEEAEALRDTAPSGLDRATFLSRLGLDPQTDLDAAFFTETAVPQTDRWCSTAPTVRKHLARLYRVLDADQRPILLEGPPGVGKTQLVIYLAQCQSVRLHRVNLSESTEMIDLVGTFVPHEGGFRFQKGPLYVAMEQGDWILVDELNLASQSVLEGLNAVLDHRRLLQVPELALSIQAAAQFRFFGTQNPAGTSAGRRPLPHSFLNRFWCIPCQAYVVADYEQVLQTLFPELDATACHCLTRWWPQQVHNATGRYANLRDVLRLATLWHAYPQTQVTDWARLLLPQPLRMQPQERAQGLPRDEPQQPHLVGISECTEQRRREQQQHRMSCWRPGVSFRGPVPVLVQDKPSFDAVVGRELLEQGSLATMTVSNAPGFYHQIVTMLGSSMASLKYHGVYNASDEQQTQPWQHSNAFATSDAVPCRAAKDSTVSWALCWGPVRLPWRDVQGPTDRGLLAGSFATPSSLPLFLPEQASYWTALAIGIAQRWPCLLVGPDAVGKASLVRAMAQLLGAPLAEILLSNQADLTELLGGYRQAMEADTTLASTGTKSARCDQAPAARFVWQPSRLLQAIQQGHWVLLRHVEALSPALVDRLNPLLEEGVTHFSVPEAPLEQQDEISEQGGVKECSECTTRTSGRSDANPIVVHPQFRIFLTVTSTTTTTTTDSMGFAGVSEALQNRCLTLWIRPDVSSSGWTRPVLDGGVATTSHAPETDALASWVASSSASGLVPDAQAMHPASNDQRQPGQQTWSRPARGYSCWPALRFFYDPLRVSIEEDLERLWQVSRWQDQGDHHDDDDDIERPSLVGHRSQSVGDWQRHRDASRRYQARHLAILWIRQHREAAGLFLVLASSADLGARLALVGFEPASPIRDLLHRQTSAALASLSTQPWLDRLQSMDMETDAETATCLTLLVVYWRCLWPWAVPWPQLPTKPTLTRETIVAMRLAALEHTAMNASVNNLPNDDTGAVNEDRYTNSTGRRWRSNAILVAAWQAIRAVAWPQGLDSSSGRCLPQWMLPNAYAASASQALFQLLQPTQKRVPASWLEAAAEEVCRLTTPPPTTTTTTTTTTTSSSVTAAGMAHASERTAAGTMHLVGDAPEDECSLETSTSSSWLIWLVLVNTARLLRASSQLEDAKTTIDSTRQQELAMGWSSLYTWLVHFGWPLPLVAAIKRVMKCFGIHGHASSAFVRGSALAQVALYWHQLLWSLLMVPTPVSMMSSPSICRASFRSDGTPCGLSKSWATLLSGWCACRCLGRTLRQRQGAFADARDRSGDFIRESLWSSMPSAIESTTDALLLETFVQLPCFEAFATSSARMDAWFRFSDDDEPGLDPALVYAYLRDEALPWLHQLQQHDQCIQEQVLNGVFYRVPGTTDCGLVQRVDLTPEQLAELDAVSHWRACYRPSAPVLDEALRYLAEWRLGLARLEEAHPTTRPAWSPAQCEHAQQLAELASAFLPAGRFHQVHDVAGLFLLQLYQGYYASALQPLLHIEQERILDAAVDWSTLWTPLALLWSPKQTDVVCTLCSPSSGSLSSVSTRAPQMMHLGMPRPRPVLVTYWNSLQSNTNAADERLLSSSWALVLDALLQEQAGLGLGRRVIQHPLVQDAWQTLVDAVWPETLDPTTDPSDPEHLFEDSLSLLEQCLGPVRSRHETATTRIPLDDADEDHDTESALWIALELLESLSMPMPCAQQWMNWEMQDEPTTAPTGQDSAHVPVSGTCSSRKHSSSPLSVPVTTSTSTWTNSRSASSGTALWQALPALVAELLDKQPNRDAAHRIHDGIAVALLLVLATRTSARRGTRRSDQEQDRRWSSNNNNNNRMACYRALLSAYVSVTSQLLELEPAAVWLSVLRQRDSMPYFWMAWQRPTGMGPAVQGAASPTGPLDEAEAVLRQLREQVHQWALEEPEQAIWLHLDEQWDTCWARLCQGLRRGQAREAIEALLEQLLEPLAQHLFHRCAFGDSNERDKALFVSTLCRLGAVMASLRLRCFGLPSFRRARRWLRYHRRVAETLPIWVRMAKAVSFGDDGDVGRATPMPTTRKQNEAMQLLVWTACGRLVEQLALGYVGPLLQLWALLADSGPCFDPNLFPWATMLQVLESYYGRYRGLIQETLHATMDRLDHAWQKQRQVLGWRLRQPWQSHIDWERYRDTVQQGQQLERQHLRALAQQLDSQVQPLLYQYRQERLRRLGERPRLHETGFDKSSEACRTPKAIQYIAGLVQDLEAYAHALSLQLLQQVTLQSIERSQRQVLQLLRERGLRRSGYVEPLELHWPQTALWLGRAPWRNLEPTRGALLDEALFNLLDALLVLDEQFWAETARQSSSGMRSVASLRSILLGLLQDMADQRLYWSCWKANIDKNRAGTRYPWPSGTDDEDMTRAGAHRSSVAIHLGTNGASTSQIRTSMGTEETDKDNALGRALAATGELTVLLSCWPSTERLQSRLQALVEQIDMLLAKGDLSGATDAASSLRSLLNSSLHQELGTVSLPQSDVLERLCHAAADLVQVMLETKTKESECALWASTGTLERSSGNASSAAPNDLWTQFQSALEEAPDQTPRPLQTMLRWRPSTLSTSSDSHASCALDYSQLEAIVDVLALLHEQLLVLAQRLAQIATTLLTLLAKASVSETATETKANEQCCEGPGLAADGAVDATARDCTAQVNATEIGEELASMRCSSTSSETVPSECDASTDAEALDVPADAFDTTDQGRLLQSEERNPDDADSCKDGPGPRRSLSDHESQLASECSLDSLDRAAQAEHSESSTPRMPSPPNGMADEDDDNDNDESGVDAWTTPANADDDQVSKHGHETRDETTSDDQSGPSTDLFLPGDRNDDDAASETTSVVDRETSGMEAITSAAVHDHEEAESGSSDHGSTTETALDANTSERPTSTDVVVETAPMASPAEQANASGNATQTGRENELSGTCPTSSMPMAWSDTMEPVILGSESRARATAKVNGLEARSTENALDGTSSAMDASSNATLSRRAALHHQECEWTRNELQASTETEPMTLDERTSPGEQVSSQHNDARYGDVVERATALSTTTPPADLSNQDADAIVALQQQQQVQGSSGVMTRASSSSSLSTEAKDEKTPASQDRARATATPEPMDVDAAIFQTASDKETEPLCWWLLERRHEASIAALTRRLEPILEYNQLTRFAGDFRTGKRLHMRRLVDYVASNYTRDRIWMRRVRPDRRQYDIVVAVDDSASMRESGAYRLALESLVVVATALHRLELGHLGVIRFGVDAQVVHGLADGMPAAGPLGDGLVRQFTFQQEATNVAAMLQCALTMLTEARQQQTGTLDPWQLVLILSDGRLGDREALRALVREANAHRQWLVFFILDEVAGHTTPEASFRATATTSVLDMKQVGFTEAGRLQIRRYLEDFPFPFYVIVQDMEALPFVFGDALTQWLAASEVQR